MRMRPWTKPRVIGELSGLRIELTNVNNIRANRSFEYGKVDAWGAVGKAQCGLVFRFIHGTAPLLNLNFWAIGLSSRNLTDADQALATREAPVERLRFASRPLALDARE